MERSLAGQMVVVGEKGECVVEGSLWMDLWGVLGNTEVQGRATKENRGGFEPVA